MIRLDGLQWVTLKLKLPVGQLRLEHGDRVFGVT
jgi:hypothetical protein